MRLQLPSRPSDLLVISLRLLLMALALGLPWALESLRPDLARTTVSEIAVRVALGGEAILGRAELAAPQAEAEHVRVHRDAQGRWWLANISQARAVEVRRAGRDELLRSLPLVSGLRFWLAGQRYRVESTAPRLVMGADDGHGWWFDGADAGTMNDGTAGERLDHCGGEGGRAGVRRAIRRGWNAVVPAFLHRRTSLSWGGHVACDGRMPMPALEPGEVRVAPEDGGYVLHTTATASRRICLADPDGECRAGAYLDERQVAIDEISRLVVGRAQFAPRLAGDELRLLALGRSEWLTPEAAAQRSGELAAHGIVWTLRGENPWQLPGGFVASIETSTTLAAGAGALLVAAFLAALVRRRVGVADGVGDPMAVGVSLSLLLMAMSLAGFLFPQAFGVGWYPWLAASAMLLLAFVPWGGTLNGLVFVGAALLLAVGMITLCTLGWQAGDSGGLRYFQKSAAAAALSLAFWSLIGYGIHLQALQVMRSVRRHGQGSPLSRTVGQEAAILAVSLVALLLLVLQTAVGAEEGVFGLQPVELGMLALVLSAAHVLALRLEDDGPQGLAVRMLLWLRGLLPLTLFLGLVAMSLFFVDDFSPMVLIAGWLAGLTAAWTVARRSLVGVVVIGVCAAIATWFYLWTQGGGLVWFAEHNFYADRFSVWVDPLHHPHSGEQYLRAAQALAQGGWSGNPVVQGWRIPAVQADFTPAFFGARFGARAVIALMVAQALWVTTLLTLGWRHLLGARSGDYTRAWRSRVMFFALWGFGFLFAGHFVLSWATNFGGLPVMGQPMPLLAAGSSLLLLLVAPFLALLMYPLADHS